jgi:hypothetical protein
MQSKLCTNSIALCLQRNLVEESAVLVDSNGVNGMFAMAYHEMSLTLGNLKAGLALWGVSSHRPACMVFADLHSVQ